MHITNSCIATYTTHNVSHTHTPAAYTGNLKTRLSLDETPPILAVGDGSGSGGLTVTNSLAGPFYWLLAELNSRLDPWDEKRFIALLVVLPRYYSRIISGRG